MKYNFIPKEAENNILSFKYSGNDRSLFYKFIGSPFSEFCVKYLPESIAPNTVNTFYNLILYFQDYFDCFHVRSNTSLHYIL